MKQCVTVLLCIVFKFTVLFLAFVLASLTKIYQSFTPDPIIDCEFKLCTVGEKLWDQMATLYFNSYCHFM